MRQLSPRELAEALGVSESSLKRWVDAGKIVATRTEGGHRRIPLPEAVRFIRETGAPLAHPEILDMPEVAIAQQRAVSGNDRLLYYLRDGDVVGARGWLLARYLGGASIAEMCDGPMRDAMATLGEIWHHDDAGIFVEHRGTDVVLQSLAHLRNLFDPGPSAPLAVGCAPEKDPYLLPSFMAATVLASVGTRAVNLGPDTPLVALRKAVEHHAPQLVWVSASAALVPERAQAFAEWLSSLPSTIITVVGGRASDALTALVPTLRKVQSMTELASVASELARRPAHRGAGLETVTPGG